MFTIKTIINGDTHLTQAECVTVGRTGTGVMLDALSLVGTDHRLDLYQYFPETYRDEECRIVDAPAFDISVPRESAHYPAHAVIVTEVADEMHPGAAGTSYQFLYPGDQAFIMNANGQTVDLIK